MTGETDASGDRGRALDDFLADKVAEGYRVEAHEQTHAIVVEGGYPLLHRLLGRGRRRYVVQVDDLGVVSMRPAEPIRH
jgi:hypothetical protein